MTAVVFLMAFGLLIGVLDNTLKNIFSRNHAKTLCDIVLFSVMIQLTAALGIGVMGGMRIPGKYSFLLSLAYGVNMIIATLCAMEALKRGPLAPNAIITTTMSCAIPTILGVVIWKETISLYQILGAAMMLFSCIMMASQTAKTSNVPVRRGWLLLVLTGGVCGGCFGMIQKVFNKVCLPQENFTFLFYGILISAVFTSVLFLVFRSNRADPDRPAVSFRLRSVVPVLAVSLGILTAADNVHNLWLVGQLPSVVFFVVLNGGRMILIGLVSTLYFKERLSGKQILGFVTGLLAVVFISGLLG